MLRAVRWVSVIGAAVLSAAFGGCARTGPTELSIAPGRYGAAFEAARDVLRDARFEIERVDARAGVITTAPKRTAGIATPWDLEQSTLGQELEDLAQNQQRRVRITFEAAERGGAGGDEETAESGADGVPPDLRDEPGDITMRVRAVTERVHRPGWRLETTAVRTSTRAEDPSLSGRGMHPEYAVAYSEDPKLGARLARAVARRLERDGDAAPDEQ